MALTKEQIARRVAQEVREGMYINLGIGIPTLVANYIPATMQVVLHSENGLLGMGPYPKEHTVDADYINAGKETITLQTGASLFHSADSFAMIRGGHIDLTILGAMEVSEQGDIANWKIPGKMVKGMGGAMDLVSSARHIIVAMQHTDKKGRPKLLKTCTLPLTGRRCVDMVITDCAVLHVLPSGGFLLLEKAADCSVDYIREVTAGALKVAGTVKDIVFE